MQKNGNFLENGYCHLKKIIDKELHNFYTHIYYRKRKYSLLTEQ